MLPTRLVPILPAWVGGRVEGDAKGTFSILLSGSSATGVASSGMSDCCRSMVVVSDQMGEKLTLPLEK